MLVAVPNPTPSDDIEFAIQEALRSAETDRILGAKVTPYILARVKELTGIFSSYIYFIFQLLALLC
ncbi:MAG: pseudouridine-5'-phosphate glycosidase, partial [bacterium]